MDELTYRVYAANGPSMGLEADRLAAALGPGELHESHFLGGEYFLWRVPRGDVRLLPNRQGPDDDEFYDVHHPQVTLVIEVSVRGGDDPVEAVAARLGYSRLT